MTKLPYRSALGISVILVALSACSYRSAENNSITATDSAPISLLAELGQHNVRVIQEGNMTRLILPSDYFFVSPTNEIEPSRYTKLNLIAQLVNSYGDTVRVKVAGYTDNVGAPQDKRDRSLQQAKNIASFLWAHGVKHDVLHIAGMGDAGPVANNQSPKSSQINRRIEIWF